MQKRKTSHNQRWVRKYGRSEATVIAALSWREAENQSKLVLCQEVMDVGKGVLVLERVALILVQAFPIGCERRNKILGKCTMVGFIAKCAPESFKD